MSETFVCSHRMPNPDGSCECGHPTTSHVRVGRTIGCDACNAERLGAEVEERQRADKWRPAHHDGPCIGPGIEGRLGGRCQDEAHWKPVEALPRKWERSNFVPSPHFLNLNVACRFVNQALGDGFGCYLVGSACTRRDYRDVDVRFIMADAAFDQLFNIEPKDGDSGRGGWLNPLWSLMCSSISLWLSQQTSLPVDFQIQRQTQANAMHDGPRHALGILIDPPEKRPDAPAPVAK